VDPALIPLKEKLEGIIGRLQDLKSKPIDWFTTKDIGHEQVRLHDVDEQYSEARFIKGGRIPQGQGTVTELLEKAHALAREIVEKLPEETEYGPEKRCHGELRHIANRLRKIISDLKTLKGREFTSAELGHLQNKLSHIDSRYHDARFQFGDAIPEGQAYVSDLLAVAHSLIEDLRFELDEPLSDEEFSGVGDQVSGRLLPVLQKLQHYERLLAHMMSMPVEELTTRDIGRVQNSIHKIDERYNQGRIAVGKKIPEGQAIISEKLNRVHELVHLVLCRMPLDEHERVDDNLQSVLKKLDFLTAELMKLKSLPPEQVSTKDVGRIQNKLFVFDAKYTQGKFVVGGGKIPQGQAIVAEKLYEAREMAHDILLNLD